MSHASGLLDRHPLPPLPPRTYKTRCGVFIGLGLGTKVGGVLLAETLVVHCQRIQRLYLGMVGIAEADMGNSMGQAHHLIPSPTPGQLTSGFFCDRPACCHTAAS